MKLEFEAGRLRPIDERALAAARRVAADSPRRRGLVRYHEHRESLQRMVHAIEPHSYVRPHKHEDPDKTEVFVALTGAAVVCRFDDAGELVEHVELRAGGPCHGVEIPPRAWHALLALESGTVLFEIVEGAYDPASHKHFAPWAPAEDGVEAGRFLARLRARLGLPPLPATRH